MLTRIHVAVSTMSIRFVGRPTHWPAAQNASVMSADDAEFMLMCCTYPQCTGRLCTLLLSVRMWPVPVAVAFYRHARKKMKLIY